MLELERVSRRFGAVQALDEASLLVRAGTVHAVLGENGAGKTTLLRVAFGLQRPDRGVVRWQGAAVSIPTPAAALALGIGMVHQHFTLVPAMTVAENVALGAGGRYDPGAAAERVREVGARAGLALDPDARVDSLPVGAQQRCEIVKALARDVRLLILDEPTAVLAPAESRELLAWIRRFADAGHAVVLITHRLRDALATADDVTVLRRGRTVYTGAAASTTEESLAAAMLGDEGSRDPELAREAMAATGEHATAPGASAPASVDTAGASTTRAAPRDSSAPVVLHADDVYLCDARGVERVRGASMVARAGEIVGIAAVEGAGQHELLRALAGLVRPHRGRVVRVGTVGWVPEDRHHDALLLDAPLYENVALKGAGARRGRMPWNALRDTTRELISRFDVRADSERALARTLSGGNQQKLVLARELAGAPDSLVVENPTRGLDFRATAAVHRALREARDRGAAVVLHSSDLDETLLLADRVYAMHDGRLTGMPKDREAVGRAMLGSEP